MSNVNGNGSVNGGVLSDRDVNAAVAVTGLGAEEGGKTVGAKDVKSMEYHRQVLQSKLDEGTGTQSYVSPSDNIQSPCSAKLASLRNKNVGKKGGKSLFAKTLGAPSKFGDKPAPSPTSQ